MGSEKSPPVDDDSMGGVGRSFFEGGGPSKLGFADVCLASSEWRRGGFDCPDFEPVRFCSKYGMQLKAFTVEKTYQVQRTLQLRDALEILSQLFSCAQYKARV